MSKKENNQVVQEQEQTKSKTKLENLEEVVINLLDVVTDMSKTIQKLEEEVNELKKNTSSKPKGLFGGKRTRTAIKDTETGVVYPSKAATGRALCEEVGTDETDHFAWYKLIAKFPDRFEELPEDSKEAQQAWEQQKKELEEYVAQENKKLQEEGGK